MLRPLKNEQILGREGGRRKKARRGRGVKGKSTERKRGEKKRKQKKILLNQKARLLIFSSRSRGRPQFESAIQERHLLMI